MHDKDFYTFRGYQMLKQERSQLSASMEDYLEMIYRNCLTDGYVRMNQLAEKLNVQVPSATRTVQRLSKLGLVDYERYGIIQVSDKGRKIGEFLLERHNIIEKFLKNLCVSEPAVVLRDTETIEHNVSISTLKNLELFNSFLGSNPDIIGRFQEYIKTQKAST
jgi:DtxR family Mn-dependent transcriptional regulator